MKAVSPPSPIFIDFLQRHRMSNNDLSREKVGRIEMVTSYTLIRVLPAKDKKAYDAVRGYPEVKEVVLTYGEYDLIVKVESNSLEELDHFVFNKLRTTDGVEATTTLIEARPTKIATAS